MAIGRLKERVIELEAAERRLKELEAATAEREASMMAELRPRHALHSAEEDSRPTTARSLSSEESSYSFTSQRPSTVRIRANDGYSRRDIAFHLESVKSTRETIGE